MKARAKLFVGSSGEAVKKGALGSLVAILRKELKQIEIVPWPDSPWGNLENALKSLRTFIVEYSYAVFLAFPDDEITIRDEEMYTARDNVIFEFGMFLSQLGAERTFLVAPNHKTIPPHRKPFRILSDVGDSFRPGGYTIHRLTANKASVTFKVSGLVQKIKALEVERLNTDRASAQLALEKSISRLDADLQEEGRTDSYYLGKLKDSIESLTRHKAIAGGKTIVSAVKDLPLYFKNLPDLCDVRQLAEVQTYKNGLGKVWVFADGPMEFEASQANDPDFRALRDAILDNLQHDVDYVYFVPSGFKTEKIEHLVSQRSLSPTVRKRIRSHISVVLVEPRLFKTYFTLHFDRNENILSVYMSSVMKNRRDILIQVSDRDHTKRIHQCIRALGRNTFHHDHVKVLDLVSA